MSLARWAAGGHPRRPKSAGFWLCCVSRRDRSAADPQTLAPSAAACRSEKSAIEQFQGRKFEFGSEKKTYPSTLVVRTKCFLQVDPTSTVGREVNI